MAVGTVISLPLSGFLADSLGWQAIFYVQGGLAAIWCVLWIFLVYDSPQQHPRIRSDELELFETSMNNKGSGEHCKVKNRDSKNSNFLLIVMREFQIPPVPWKAVLTSGPFWAILIAHTCSNFGWYMLLVELPTYMKQILRFRISEVKPLILFNCNLSAITNIFFYLECAAIRNPVLVHVDLQRDLEQPIRLDQAQRMDFQHEIPKTVHSHGYQ